MLQAPHFSSTFPLVLYQEATKTWWFILTPLITIQLTSLKSLHQLNQKPRFTLTQCSFEGYHRLAKYVFQPQPIHRIIVGSNCSSKISSQKLGRPLDWMDAWG